MDLLFSHTFPPQVGTLQLDLGTKLLDFYLYDMRIMRFSLNAWPKNLTSLGNVLIGRFRTQVELIGDAFAQQY